MLILEPSEGTYLYWQQEEKKKSEEHVNLEDIVKPGECVLEGKLCVLKPVIKYSKITITFHGIWMIKPKLAFINVQGFLLIYSGLFEQKSQEMVEVNSKRSKASEAIKGQE